MKNYFFGLVIFTLTASVANASGANENTTPASCFQFDSSSHSITKYLCSDKDVIIPNRINGQAVTAIGGFSFHYSDLTSVVIPDTVETIGNGAFENNQLTSVIIPDRVKKISSSAFANNVLVSVKLPSMLQIVEHAAFYNNQLSEVTLPGSTRFVGWMAFERNQLKSIELPEGLLILGQDAFSENSITSVSIPSSVRQAWTSAFPGVSSMSFNKCAVVWDVKSNDSVASRSQSPDASCPGSDDYQATDYFWVGHYAEKLLARAGVNH
jgi:hypothetical protein